MSDHSIWVLEYGFVDRFPASNLFAAQPNEGHRRMPYCFALVRSAGRCALVDTVILTHNHFDHAGCAGAFPNAHIYIQQREIAQYEAALRRPRRFEYLTRSCEPGLPALMAEREREGLGTYVDGAHEVAPGLAVRPAFDTHTAGSQVVTVSNEADGDWIFAGDDVYSYENLEGLHDDGILAPIAMTTGSATDWLAFADGMLSAVGDETRRIIPFHENRLWDRFPSHEFDDELHLAEITLAGGHTSLVEALT